ncbi:hypothetical protein LOTGIDRAFT_234510 [Lottia gigantea]|uniref:Uncharacterized protein n=1 Tax=Lottia gigantea TaxID=225164 RepID=V4A0L6_LOTGI|nr:hypothetical protein LOTGIDRAFT_234510 [Lottia gigantea]ESO88445.1 hypothetical protein LOTGIDRAFT_234510 [Lottia gigantea]
MTSVCIPSYNWTCLGMGAGYAVSGIVLIILHYTCSRPCGLSWGIDFNLGAGVLTCLITGIIQILFLTCVMEDKNTDDIGYGFSIAVVAIGFIMVIANSYVLFVRGKERKTCTQCPGKKLSAAC